MKTTKFVPQNPIILRCHRVMEGFSKSDDERDFYLDKLEGFMIYVDLDKPQEELDALFKELEDNEDRYISLPKMTFYEIKKLMESFVNEKIYDIDTKEKLLDIIQSKEARENFLEFIYDHHSELEKWQQYYQERFRIKIIEWLRNNAFDFVFEEDVELTKSIVEKVKLHMFTPKAGKDIAQARKGLVAKAATYYSNEALNPRPKRGRPPKQVVKVEAGPQFSSDIYISVPKAIKPFLFVPDYHSSSMIFTFSGKYASEADLLAHRKQQLQTNLDLQTLSQKLAALKTLSSNWNREGQEGSFGEALAADIVPEQAEPEAVQEAVAPRPAAASRKVSPVVSQRPRSRPSRPAQPPAKPAQPPAKPAQPPAKPVRPPAKPARPPAKPARPPAKPARSPAKPARSPAKPARSSAKPARSSAKPVRPPAKPVRSRPQPPRRARPAKAKPVAKKPLRRVPVKKSVPKKGKKR
jgi:hypothetical protein